MTSWNCVRVIEVDINETLHISEISGISEYSFRNISLGA